MILPIGEADLPHQLPCAPKIVGPVAARHERGHEDVFEDGTLRQKTVVLEDEADLGVSKFSDRGGRQLKGIATEKNNTSGRGRVQPA